MARFIIAHLQLGTLNEIRILDSATALLMQSPAFRHAEQVNPMLYGFYEMSQNGIRIFGHGGDTFWFHSLMALFPDQQMGLFISLNSQSEGFTCNEILERFTDRYFPEEVETIYPPFADNLENYTGTYALNRYSHDDLFKIMKILMTAKLSIQEDGYMAVTVIGDKSYYVPIAKDVFRNRNNSENIVFKRDENGKVNKMFIDGLPFIALEKLEWIESPGFHLSLLIISLMIILITIIYWAIEWLVKRRLGIDKVPVTQLPKNAKILGWITCLFVLLYYAGFMLANNNPNELVYGITGFLKFVLLIPFLIIILTLWMIWITIRLWRNIEVNLWNRIYYSLLVIILAGSIWQWNYWNLIGF
jgi:hypothetical protein